MATERLYEGEAYCWDFEAVVQSCTQTARGWEVVLNRTAFYPEGGGQSADTGTLGGARVLDVQRSGDEIVHLCDRAVPHGSVHGTVDWARRMDLMQQHGGEHILSGLIHTRFGYANVGFHMGADVVTADFDGPLSLAQLSELELAANRAIRSNAPIRCYYPAADTLNTLSYRAKENLHGPVRLVEIVGIDCCACCGTHVHFTGEIGLLLVLSAVKFRGGTRVELLCGDRAIRYYQTLAAQNRSVSQRLSAKPTAISDAVGRMQDELAAAQRTAAALEERLIALLAAQQAGQERVLIFEQLAAPALRALATRLLQGGVRCCLVCAADGDGYRYVIAARDMDLRDTVRALHAHLGGRGGGKPDFAQGSLRAGADEIRAFWVEI